MPNPGVDIDIQGGPEFRRAANAMRKVGRDLVQELEDTLTRDAYAMRESARQGIMRVPSSGRYGTNIRARTQQALKVEHDQATGLFGKLARARIVLDDSMLPPEHSKVPMLLDRRGGWRHPVYGNRDVWVNQRGRQWFRLRMMRFRRIIQADLKHTMDEAVKYVDRQI